MFSAHNHLAQQLVAIALLPLLFFARALLIPPIEARSISAILGRAILPVTSVIGNGTLGLTLLVEGRAPVYLLVDFPHRPTPAPLLIFGAGCCGRVAEDYAWIRGLDVVAVRVQPPPWTTIRLDVNEYHSRFAADLALVASSLPALGVQPGSPLNGRISDTLILGGHSWGAGFAVIAAASMPPDAISGMLLFAPGLHTMPPAAMVAPAIRAPMLIVGGEADCADPVTLDSETLLHSVGSDKKALVVVRGANHGQWTGHQGGGRYAANSCSRLLEAREQQAAGLELARAFAEMLGGVLTWLHFGRTIELGSARWWHSSFVDGPNPSRTDPPPSQCPCGGDSGRDSLRYLVLDRFNGLNLSDVCDLFSTYFTQVDDAHVKEHPPLSVLAPASMLVKWVQEMMPLSNCSVSVSSLAYASVAGKKGELRQ